MRWLAVVLVTGWLATVGPPASAKEASASSSTDGDARHCVTRREVWIIGKNLSREQVERRWEVRGRGTRAGVVAIGSAITYPLCGETAHVAFAQYGHPMVLGVASTRGLSVGQAPS